jgi:hypothetical protein
MARNKGYDRLDELSRATAGLSSQAQRDLLNYFVGWLSTEVSLTQWREAIDAATTYIKEREQE